MRLALGTVDVLAVVRTTRVVLAAAHRDHDTSNNTDTNLAAFCQRCTLSTTGPSTGGAGGPRCSAGMRWATCLAGRIRNNEA